MIIEINPFPFCSNRNKYFEILYNGINNKYYNDDILKVKNKTLGNVLFIHFLQKFKGKRIIHIHWSTQLYGSKYILKSACAFLKNFVILSILKLY